MLVDLEFLVEPFKEGEPGTHVTAALDAAQAAGLAPELGAFATTAHRRSLHGGRGRPRSHRRRHGRGRQPASDPDQHDLMAAHPLVKALRPVSEAIGATIVPPPFGEAFGHPPRMGWRGGWCSASRRPPRGSRSTRPQCRARVRVLSRRALEDGQAGCRTDARRARSLPPAPSRRRHRRPDGRVPDHDLQLPERHRGPEEWRLTSSSETPC